MSETAQKLFKDIPKAALAFSGGVDSTCLLYAGLSRGADVRAYYVKTAFQPEFEYRDALKAADLLGAGLTVLTADILSNKIIAANPPDRCYHCKSVIFGLIRERALSDGFTVLLDGTNASDDASDRPGMRALTELSVRSPLRECGLSKDDVRRLSRQAGLFTWDKPAYACLATRIPVGLAITDTLLNRIERSENVLFGMGFRDFRARVTADGYARLQFKDGQIALALEKRDLILKELGVYFKGIELDLKGR